MLDVSITSPVPVAVPVARATVLVTPAGGHDVEVRVWPPEEVVTVAELLSRGGHRCHGVLPDETGLPGSLLVEGAEEGAVKIVLDDLAAPQVAALGVVAVGYLGPDGRGECSRLPGPVAEGRDEVVFVDVCEQPVGGRWQVRAFGAPGALQRLSRAAADLALGTRGGRPARANRSLAIQLPGRPGVVQDLVARLEAAGLDGHVRVLRYAPA